MSTQPLLSGVVELSQEQIRRLQGENQRISDALQRAIDEGNQLRQETRDLKDAVSQIQSLLSPLHRSLRLLFGEIDRVSKETDFSAGSGSNSVWESWKKKMPGKPAEFIDLLLTHGEMTGAQLTVAARCSKKSVYDTIAKLNRAQLLVKNGGKFSLKQL